MGYELYVITDSVIGRGRPHEEIARRALEGGADAVQLRDKRRSARELVTIGRAIRHTARDALFIVNDRLDVALACEADGVHLGRSDMPIRTARRLAPRDFIIGASVSCAPEATYAVQQGADYVAVSPVFRTSTKRDAGPPCGTVEITRVQKAVEVPVIAIGGIELSNVREVLEAGADGVAVISAVVAQPDITRAARDMKACISAVLRRRKGRLDYDVRRELPQTD
jgi:thiamine-phosphate pyrophosphorylase